MLTSMPERKVFVRDVFFKKRRNFIDIHQEIEMPRAPFFPDKYSILCWHRFNEADAFNPNILTMTDRRRR